MAKKLTIKKIAQLSGVSAGTVDRVLHNRGRVSEEAYAKVRKVLDKQDYRRNIHTSAVSLKKTFRLAVAIPRSEKGEYWDLIRDGIIEAEVEYSDISMDTFFCFFDQFDSLSCKEAFEGIPDINPSAVIIGTTFVEETKQLCEVLEAKNIPYVFVDGFVEGTKPVAVFSANQDICGRILARMMDAFTPDTGDIAIFHPKRKGTMFSNNSLLRLKAFKEYFREEGKLSKLKEGYFSVNNPDAVIEEVSEFLKMYPNVGGISVLISTGYIIADALSALGRTDICVGGFDITANNARCLLDGSLDMAVSQRPETQGFDAVEYVIRYLLYSTLGPQTPGTVNVQIVLKENLS